MRCTQFENVSKGFVLIKKETLEKLIQIANQVDKIEIDETCVKTEKKRGSLRGLWKDSQISENLFLEARRSLFTYFDAPLITKDDQITQSEIVSVVW